MLNDSFIVISVITTLITLIDRTSAYGFKFSSNYNDGPTSQQTPNYFWNGFRTYPQNLMQSTPIQIKFEDENDSNEDPEYMYELLFGHQVKDIEKFNRQKGCLCNNRFKDPHCGSDYKVYDNGCYFECAQKRTPGLKLVNWGKC